MPRALFQHLEADRQFEILRTGLVKTAQRTVVLPGARLDKCHVLASNDATLEFARAKGVKSATFFEDPMLDERDALVEYQSRPSRTRPQVLWVGRMLPRKGVELVIKAFAKSKVEADLIVVGDGPRMARAREMVRNLSVEDRVKFTGEISRQEVGALMRSSDIFLFASLRDSMPAQLLEAMAAGLPIVCLDIYGNSRLVPDEAGIKVPVIDAEQVVDGLGRAVRELVQSQSARESMGRRAYLASLDQAWPKKVARMSEIYRTIVT